MRTTRRWFIAFTLTAATFAGCEAPDPAHVDAVSESDESTTASLGERDQSTRQEDLLDGAPSEFNAEDDLLRAYYPCLDACSELVSCWRKCVQAGKVSTCLQSGYECSLDK